MFRPSHLTDEAANILAGATDERVYCHRALRLVDLEPQLVGQEPAHRGHNPFAGTTAANINVASSSGGEFHPSALREPDVRLSPHPAPTLQPPVARRVATGQTDWGPAAQCTPASAWMRVPGA